MEPRALTVNDGVTVAARGTGEVESFRSEDNIHA
jgi:hypothetical protein